MKILTVELGHSAGTQQVVLELLLEWSRLGVRVTLLTYQHRTRIYGEACREAGVDWEIV